MWPETLLPTYRMLRLAKANTRNTKFKGKKKVNRNAMFSYFYEVDRMVVYCGVLFRKDKEELHNVKIVGTVEGHRVVVQRSAYTIRNAYSRAFAAYLMMRHKIIQ